MTKTREDGPDPAAALLMLAQKQYARCGEIEELTRELSDALDRTIRNLSACCSVCGDRPCRRQTRS